MSLIFGINLADRVYLASDCRVSHYKNKCDKKPSLFLDCINKSDPLTDDIVVAAAGNTHLASYLYSNLKKEKFIKEGINKLRKEIEKWIKNQINEYLKDFPYTAVCLIFGGLDRSKKKRIDGKKIITHVKEFQELTSSGGMQMKEAIYKGISAKPNQPNPQPELPVADSHVFGIISNAKESIFEISDTEWGEFLAYGPKGFRKENVPKTLFGQLEFEHGCGDKDHDRILLTMFIKNCAQEYGLESVGGAVVVSFVLDSIGAGIISGKVWTMNVATKEEKLISEVSVINGKLYGRTEGGILTQLTPFYEYKYKKGEYLL